MATYASRTELQGYLRIPVTATEHNEELDLALEAASRLIDQFCNQSFDTTASTTRYFTPYYDAHRDRYVVDLNPGLPTASATVTSDTQGDNSFTSTVTVEHYLPKNGPAPYTTLILDPDSSISTSEFSLRVVAAQGWATVPDAVKQATLMQASRFYNRRFSPYGIAGSPDSGFGELRLLSAIDADVRLILQPYVLHWGAR